MHVKDPWIRSVLFALSGLMLAIGVIKMKEQAKALMVITGGLVSLAILLVRILDKANSGPIFEEEFTRLRRYVDEEGRIRNEMSRSLERPT